MPEVIDLTRQRFGRLIVIDRSYPNQNKHLMWLCKCDCEKEKIIVGYNLKRNHTKSCGCLRKELTSARNRKDLDFLNRQNLSGN
jgi:hypothetical protein